MSLETDPPPLGRVLVVEDEGIIAADITQSLQALGFSVCGTADTAEDAVRRAREERPDLILMDVQLRGPRDGIEAARDIVASQRVPVVFLTAFADEPTLQRARQAEPYGYLLKPFDERDLHVTAIMALAKHRAFLDLDRRVEERTQELLRSEARSRQLAAVSQLGLFALGTRELQPLLAQAADAVAEVLGVEAVGVLRRSPEGTTLVLAAGAGRAREDVRPDALLPLRPDTLEAQVLSTRQPVVMQESADPVRTPSVLPCCEGQPVSGLAVPIDAAPGRPPFGVLEALSCTDRTFSAVDLAFLQAVGSVVATAAARVESEAQRLAAERAAEFDRLRTTQAEEALQARDDFLCVASHELRTPLTALQLQLHSLQERLGVLDLKVGERMERATRSTERLSSLVESLLDVSQLTTGRMQLVLEEVDLARVASEVTDRLQPVAERCGCALEVRCAGAVCGRWDRLRLEQVLVNLVSNALKFGPGRPVRVDAGREGDEAVLRVTDQGPGVTAEAAGRIFRRFERAVPVRHFGGLGIGLFIAHELVAAHGGTVSVESAPGQGACFTVRLPLRPDVAHA